MQAPDWLLQHKVTVPFRRKGRAKITRYKLTAKRCEEVNWQIVLHAQDGLRPALRTAWSYPGKYTGLMVDGITVTSDEAKEIADQLPFIEAAYGRILLTGLGIGMCLQALLRKESVEHVTVVEECSDVLSLVAPHYQKMFCHKRMTFVHADALSWQPLAGTHFDYAYHDIWPVAAGFFWPQHESLYRRYADYATQQDSWRAEWMRSRYQKEFSR